MIPKEMERSRMEEACGKDSGPGGTEEPEKMQKSCRWERKTKKYLKIPYMWA